MVGAIKTRQGGLDQDIPGIIETKCYFIVDAPSGRIIERLSTSGMRVLRDAGLHEFTIKPEKGPEVKGLHRLSDEDMVRGLTEGRFTVKTQEEILASLDKAKTGIGITGGGDSAGIADCISSLQQNLSPELTLLGVRNAGKGLMTPPERFNEQLIIVDGLAAKDYEGQSSTPYGSSREDPLKKSPETTKANIRGRGFFHGIGGNDHLGLLERIAQEFPDMIIVGTFKSIDGDGWVAGQPAQMLGFHTAVIKYQEAIWSIAQNAKTHNQWHVVETFGRGAGKLAFEAARRYPPNYNELPAEEQRKIREFRNSMMILVPEKETTLRSIAEEAKRTYEREGSVVVEASEGFMPPEMRHEINRLAKREDLKQKWLAGELRVEDIKNIIEVVDEGDPRKELKKILEDRELAAQFGKTVWETKLDPHGNVATLTGISSYIAKTLEAFAGAKKVNKMLETYEARGATPTEYDRIMAEKIGRKMAELINNGVKGGKAVVYFEGMNPLTEEPAVVDLVGVSDKNNLNNTTLYPTEILQENGVFWKKEDLSKYLKAA
ncbi:MAG: 6-phosphofructokinase [Candidatus Altiarchaeota archaeon]|nr:6-phosphofructokinase [Candidatus Altiarchaeota archaeon]